MFKDEILENERRAKIYARIRRHPGLHLRELQRVMQIPLTSLQYHLNYMARRNIVYEEKSEHYTRYYCKLLESEDKKVLSILRQKRLREIVLLTLISKKIKSQFLVQALKLSPSTVSAYLSSLVESGVLLRTKIGYENTYTLKDEGRIERVLVAYRSSLIDRMVDKWVSTWIENRFSPSRPGERTDEPK